LTTSRVYFHSFIFVYKERVGGEERGEMMFL